MKRIKYIIILVCVFSTNLFSQTVILKIDNKSSIEDVKNLEIINYGKKNNSDGHLVIELENFSECEGTFLEFKVEIGKRKFIGDLFFKKHYFLNSPVIFTFQKISKYKYSYSIAYAGSYYRYGNLKYLKEFPISIKGELKGTSAEAR